MRRSLPLAHRDDVAMKEVERTMNGPASRPRILVIDHDDEARTVLCNQLSAFGFEAVTENNGVSGLSRVASDYETTPIHGLLVELQMPVLGGLAVLQEMVERFQTVPVIVMSDAAHVAKLRQAIRLGAREYLIKPIDRELLRRKCEGVFLEEKGLPFGGVR